MGPLSRRTPLARSPQEKHHAPEIPARLLLAGALATFATLAAAEPDSKWRLKFDHWAEVDGELVLRIAPLNGTRST
jgi:hypothetical protein